MHESGGELPAGRSHIGPGEIQAVQAVRVPRSDPDGGMAASRGCSVSLSPRRRGEYRRVPKPQTTGEGEGSVAMPKGRIRYEDGIEKEITIFDGQIWAEHSDGSRCPRTGKGKHRQRPSICAARGGSSTSPFAGPAGGSVRNAHMCR